MNEPMFEIKEEESQKNYSKFVVSPLEQGYGDTLGNALRRVLLTSLPGAAISSVRISGVKHQFSTLKGMKEDVVEFLLNLKKVRFSLEKPAKAEEKPVKATISVKSSGDCQVTETGREAQAAIHPRLNARTTFRMNLLCCMVILAFYE